MYNSIFREILFYSRLNPDAPAIVSGKSMIGYGRFVSDIERVTRALAAESLPQGARVVVNIPQTYRSWLVIFALARMGLPSATATAAEVGHVGATVYLCDSPAADLGPGVRVLVMSPEWFEQKMQESFPPFRDPEVDPRSICRIVLSSGTTGMPKRVGITHETLQARCLFVGRSYDLNRSARFLADIGVSTVAGYVMPVAAWYCGAAVVIPRGGRGFELHESRVTSAFTSPTRLAEYLEYMPADAPPMPELKLFVGGAPLSPSLNERTRQRLTPQLYIIYGSTEVSTASLALAAQAMDKPGFVGFCPPYARMEVVDAQHAPVPIGQEGALRIRAPGMVTEYLEDSDATARYFRDGWFYPGDTGVLDASGAFRVIGRVTEIANLGGIKIAPHLVDEALAGAPGVADIATFSVSGPVMDRLCVAIVPSEGLDQQELARRFSQAFPTIPLPTFVRIDQIPRNEMGKPMRARLRELTERELSARQGQIH